MYKCIGNFQVIQNGNKCRGEGAARLCSECCCGHLRRARVLEPRLSSPLDRWWPFAWSWYVITSPQCCYWKRRSIKRVYVQEHSNGVLEKKKNIDYYLLFYILWFYYYYLLINSFEKYIREPTVIFVWIILLRSHGTRSCRSP